MKKRKVFPTSYWPLRQLFYMLNNLEFGQRPMARAIGKDHGAGISGFVNKLERMGYLRKNPVSSTKKPNYEVVSPVILLEYITRLR